MNAGIPGAGIGGIYYVLLSLLMPFIEMYQTLKGRSSLKRWALVMKQAAIAWGIIISIELMGSLLNAIPYLLKQAKTALVAAFSSAAASHSLTTSLSVVTSHSLVASRSVVAYHGYSMVVPLMLSFIILSGVLLTIHIMRIFLAQQPDV